MTQRRKTSARRKRAPESNRREHVRGQLELPMMTRVQERELEVEALNISMGGAFVLTEEKWPLGTELKVAFVHGGSTYKGTAVVVHQMIRNYRRGVGVKFVNVSPGFHSAIRRILAEISRTPA